MCEQEVTEVTEKNGRTDLATLLKCRAFHNVDFRLSKIKDSQLERELLYLGECARNENGCQEKKLVAV
jgi:hypothetical protein